MREVRVRLGERTYPILIDPGLLECAGPLIVRHGLAAMTAVISDRTVNGLFSKVLLESLRAEGIDAFLIEVPDGENSKSLEQTEKLYSKLIRAGLKRDGLIIALGGGVVGDLAGFAAATYLRGVNFVQIPTTLLAQVDSSVGGKVGVNHPLGKNMIGSFHQPKLVIIDPLVLDTLPMRERWAGAAEVVKIALVRDPALFGALDRGMEDLIALVDVERVSGVLETCCALKAEIVGRDEKEAGLRRILNFGHTVGHALEAATKYGFFRHGETVAYGMAWALQFSLDRGFMDASHFKRADALLRRIPLPPIPESVSAASLLHHIGLDKKQTAEGLNLVLLKEIGRAVQERTDDFGNSLDKLLNRQIIDL
jgi:3-dehydroquinate synthase